MVLDEFWYLFSEHVADLVMTLRLGAFNDEAQPLAGAVGRWGAQAPTHKTFERLGMKGAWYATPRPQATIFGFGENIFLNFKC